MKLSLRGEAFIKDFEKLRTKPYLDVVGKWTIGWGHLMEDQSGEDQRERTVAECQQIWLADIAPRERAVENYLTTPFLLQHQFDALVSFVFNVGAENFRNSTLRRIINQTELKTQQDVEDAGEWFLPWNKGTIDGKKIILPGLDRRRKLERIMFVEGGYLRPE